MGVFFIHSVTNQWISALRFAIKTHAPDSKNHKGCLVLLRTIIDRPCLRPCASTATCTHLW